MASRKLFALLLGALAVVAGVWLWQSRTEPVASAAGAPAETIAESGRILGLAIGSPISEARARLDPLRIPVEYTPDTKEETGRRIYWKLKETEYEWVMVWAKADGTITRIRAVFRPEATKPFSEIGNPQTAASVGPERARWNLQRPDGTHFRLIAQGANERATSVYMFSLELAADRHEKMAGDDEEKP